jgi:hypothetical protein
VHPVQPPATHTAAPATWVSMHLAATAVSRRLCASVRISSSTAITQGQCRLPRLPKNAAALPKFVCISTSAAITQCRLSATAGQCSGTAQRSLAWCCLHSVMSTPFTCSSVHSTASAVRRRRCCQCHIKPGVEGVRGSEPFGKQSENPHPKPQPRHNMQDAPGGRSVRSASPYQRF